MADYDHDRVIQAAKMMQENRTGLVLTGRIKDGKLELDKATQDEIAQKFAKADRAFIAMNSPFATKSLPV
jgi:hypothetical protein